MGTGLEIGAGMALVSGLLSYAITPKSPSMDMTNYDLLRQTQEQANAESDAARARIEEARKREELRQQQLAGQNILTSDTGADTDSIGVRNQVLGSSDDEDDEDS
ncbi:MAG: hypothetical protein LBQ10_12040 [Desulfovibrio sp.]|jgi:hypothetical protein|nr:hypothetical protein [Desulfovibrio sp.]